jgi:cation transport ATPase
MALFMALSLKEKENMSNQPYPPDPRNFQRGPDQVPYGNPEYGANQDTIQSADINGAHNYSQHESYIDPQGNRVENREEFFEDTNQRRANIRYWITTVTYFVLGVLEVLLGLRLIFRLLGANEYNNFITFLYTLTHVFVGPFNGIFNDQALGHSVFEVSTLIAMLIYALLAWGIVSLGRVLFAPVLPEHRRVTTTRHY